MLPGDHVFFALAEEMRKVRATQGRKVVNDDRPATSKTQSRESATVTNKVKRPFWPYYHGYGAPPRERDGAVNPFCCKVGMEAENRRPCALSRPPHEPRSNVGPREMIITRFGGDRTRLIRSGQEVDRNPVGFLTYEILFSASCPGRSCTIFSSFCYSEGMKRSEIAFGLLRIPVDFAMVVLGFLLRYKLRLQGDFIPCKQFEVIPANFLPVEDYFEFSLLFGAMLVAVFFFFGLYRLRNTEGGLRESRSVIKHSLVWMLMVMSYFFITREIFFSRLVLIFGAILAVFLIILARILLRSIEHLLLDAGIGQRRVLLLGANKISQRIADRLQKDPHYHVVGYLAEGSKRITNLKFLGSLKELRRMVRKNKVESIIQTSRELSTVEDHEILEFCRESQLEYRFVPDILEVERSNVEIEPIGGYPLIHLKPTPLDGWGRIYKRSADVAISGLGLVLLSPLFLIIALGIKVDSTGPIFFTRLEDGSPAFRIGQNGKKFKFFKFRSMKHNTHHLRYGELAEQNHRKGPLVKIKNDPRITGFGRWLRKTSFDELPNLWNVFKGDMSLAGPRPHLPEEVDNYEGRHHFLLTIKPGITGLSQISGRSDLDFEEEVRLDSYYIKHWSPWLDLKILIKTCLVVLKGKAAD